MITGVLDVSLLFEKSDIAAILPDPGKAFDFLGEQYRAKTHTADPQAHVRFKVTEPTPCLKIRELGEGTFGFIYIYIYIGVEKSLDWQILCQETLEMHR